jgi:aryl-alcohol dehydrogenase-like predicted oxidoreductase
MQLDCIDLIQLHCPPTEVYYRPEIFGLFEDLQQEGKIKHLGVSVEKVEEAIKAIEFENVATVQIIYNIFRQRPNDLFFDLAQTKNVGVIVRVPLASGLLSGKYTQATTFGEGDHRHGNRNGEWFDKGETFAGVPYELGLAAVEKLKSIFPANDNLASIALKWILMNARISVVIPGATKSSHLVSNTQTSELADISASQLTQVQAVYDEMIKPHVHQLW